MDARRDDRPNNGFIGCARRGCGTGLLFGLLLLPLNVVAQQAGDLDPTFGVGGKVLTDISGDNDEGRDVALQPDGRIVVAGYSPDFAAGVVQFALTRYLPDGTLDPSFGDSGVVLTGFGNVNALAFAVALQPDGGILAAGGAVDRSGANFKFALARYLPDGTLDTTFSGDGTLTIDVGDPSVNDIAIQTDGKIVAVGTTALARFHPDGTLDATFGTTGVVGVDFEQYAAVLQPDGKIVTAGQFLDVATGEREFALARFQTDGSLDPDFGSAGRMNIDVGGDGFALSLTLQPDGRLIAAGYSDTPTGASFTLIRTQADGTLDTSFDGDGRVTTDFGAASVAYGAAVQTDGKIVASGVGGLARYLPDGTLDTTFSADGIVSDFGGVSLVVQADGRLLVAGAFTSTGEGGFDFALARYLSAVLPGVGPPTDKAQCKHNGWRAFTIPRAFRNQGDCIQFVNTGT